MRKNKKFYQAVATMVGYTIGVGMFGLPFIVAKSGILIFLIYMVLINIIQYNIHLTYANVILSTKAYHRLPGFAEIYLGKLGKYFAFFAKVIGNYGALLAYIIISGSFLFQLFGEYFGGSEFMYASGIFLIEAIVVYFGIAMVAKAELIMTGLLFMIVFLIAFKGLDQINLQNYIIADWRCLFLPYGATLFALDGNGSLPIVAKLVKRDPKEMKKVIRTSMTIVTIVMFAFILTIVGVSGVGTSQNALSGVTGLLDSRVIVMALLFGVVCMMTSVFGVAEAVKETLNWDFKINKNLAYILAVGVPYLLYVLGFDNLINVINFAGAIAGGSAATILMLIFLKVKKKYGKIKIMERQPGNYFAYILITMFFIGMMIEIFSYIS